MRGRMKIRIGLAAGVLALLAGNAHGQLQVGDETTLNLIGSASVGYTRSWDGSTSQGAAYGMDAVLSGVYHDTRFLNFSVSPYLNQSNVNSNFNSNSLASGVNAQANFLNDSRTPIQLSYARDYNREGTFNVPGSTGNFVTIGSGQAFSLNAGYLPEDKPSLHGSFAHSSSDYEVVGVPGSGSSHANQVGLSSAYVLWDTNLSASYTKNWINSESPAFGAPGTILGQDTTQDILQISASRPVFNRASLSGGYSRSHVHGNYADSVLDSTYNTLYGNLSVPVGDRFSVSGHANYNSDLSGQFFSNVISGLSGDKGVSQPSAQGTATGGNNLSYTTNFLSYGATGSYRWLQNLVTLGSIDHRIQGQSGGLSDFTSTIMQLQTTWTHKLLGGGLGIGYGFSYSFAPLYSFQNNPANPGTYIATQTGTASFRGNNASVSYGRQFGNWSGSISGSYSQGLTTVVVGYTQTAYTATASVSRNVKYWNVALHSSYSNSHLNGSTLADNRMTNYGGSLSHGSLGISGSYSQSSGNALQVGTGIVPTPIPVGGPQNLLIQYHGDSYGVGVGWRPMRRLNFSGAYSHANYTTINPLSGSLPVRSSTEQYFARTEYYFRQLFVYTGYSHVGQGYSQALFVPASYNVYYFGVVRRFNFF